MSSKGRPPALSATNHLPIQWHVAIGGFLSLQWIPCYTGWSKHMVNAIFFFYSKNSIDINSLKNITVLFKHTFPSFLATFCNSSGSTLSWVTLLNVIKNKWMPPTCSQAHKSNTSSDLAWQHVPAILTLRRMKQEDCHEFEVGRGYIVSSRPSWTT